MRADQRPHPIIWLFQMRKLRRDRRRHRRDAEERSREESARDAEELARRRRTPVSPLSFKLDKLPWPIGLLSAIFIQVGENPRAGVSDAVA